MRTNSSTAPKKGRTNHNRLPRKVASRTQIWIVRDCFGERGCEETIEGARKAYFKLAKDMSEFKSFRFTKNISLSFASYDTGRLKWGENVRYLQDSVHIFRCETDVYGSLNLVTPEGRHIPGVPHYLLKEVNSLDESSSPKSKRVLEAFPAPVPGFQLDKKSWECPYTFDSLRVIRDDGVRSSLHDCSAPPVAYLRLVEGDHDKLYYRCSFFGVPRRKVAKV